MYRFSLALTDSRAVLQATEPRDLQPDELPQEHVFDDHLVLCVSLMSFVVRGRLCSHACSIPYGSKVKYEFAWLTFALINIVLFIRKAFLKSCLTRYLLTSLDRNSIHGAEMVGCESERKELAGTTTISQRSVIILGCQIVQVSLRYITKINRRVPTALCICASQCRTRLNC